MSLFSVGGNAGFALGPILITPAVLVFGLSGTLLVAVLPLLIAVVLAFELPKLKARTAAAAARQRRARARRRPQRGRRRRVRAADRGHLRALGDLLRPAVLRADLVHPRVRRPPRRRRTARWPRCWSRRARHAGRRPARGPDRPARACSSARSSPRSRCCWRSCWRRAELAAGVLLAAIGFVTVMSFSVSVVMGQEYLPSRLGIASGVTLGWRSASAASPRRCSACSPTPPGWRP